MLEMETSMDPEVDHVTALKELRTSLNKCSECHDTKEIVSTEDFVTAYSKLLNCVLNHRLMSVTFKDFYKLFIVEHFVLKHICDPEFILINEVIEGKYKKLYKNKEDLALLSEQEYKPSISDFDCEQSVESLMYKVYEKMNKSDNFKEGIEYLLIILYLRKEYKRFYKIYKNIEKTELIERLGFLLSQNEDCEFTMGEKTEKVKNWINLDEKYLKKNFADLLELVCLENEDKNIWKANVLCHVEWNDKARAWMRNRSSISGTMDRIMIDECISNKKFEDGWTIFKFGSIEVREEYHKACLLCVSALSDANVEVCVNADIWVSRLIDLMNKVIDSHEVSMCCELVHDLFYKMAAIPEIFRQAVVKAFIKKIRIMENNEKIVTYIIQGISKICRKFRNTETCEICVKHANMIYKEWKRNNIDGIFYKSHSKFENEIYEGMLDICEAVDDCSGFKGVCKDLIDNDAKIDKKICEKLQNSHSKYCTECGKDGCRVPNVSNDSQLLSKLLSNFRLDGK